jgi:hypothetical protein
MSVWLGKRSRSDEPRGDLARGLPRAGLTVGFAVTAAVLDDESSRTGRGECVAAPCQPGVVTITLTDDTPGT